MRKKHWLVLTLVLVAALAITPAYVRAYRVLGASDAPSFLTGDRIVINRAAYDLRLPYTCVVILAHSAPESGDVVSFQAPGGDYLVFKRVVGCPGDRIEMQDHHLRINGSPLEYRPIDESRFDSVATANNLGAIVEEESGAGKLHLVSYNPGPSPLANFGPLLVPQGHYFVLGDNRSNSEDSRAYGPVARRAILGKVYRVSR